MKIVVSINVTVIIVPETIDNNNNNGNKVFLLENLHLK